MRWLRTFSAGVEPAEACEETLGDIACVKGVLPPRDFDLSRGILRAALSARSRVCTPAACTAEVCGPVGRYATLPLRF